MKKSDITILFVYPTLFNPERGGIERVTVTLTRAFVKQGYKVIYLHHRSDIKVPDYDYPAPVFFFPSTDYNVPENYTFYHLFLKEEKINIVINQAGNFGDSKLYLSLGDNTHVKTISVLHSNPLLNYDYFSEETLKLRNNSFIEYVKLSGRFLIYSKLKKQYWESRVENFSFLFDHTDIVCLLSENYKKEIQRVYSKQPDKIVAIGNPNSFRVNTLPLQKEKILLYVGRLTKGEKRPDRLLKIWKKIYKDFPAWKLIIVGDGPEREQMEKEASRMKNIHFEGYQNPEEYYKKASLFCMTSNFEGFPMVLTEAMQMGAVPVAFDSFAAVSDVIKSGETGYLVRPFDLDEYADKLKLLMSDEEERKKMAQTGFQYIKRYNVNRIVEQWENLFNRLLYNEQ
ncbi:glycosyl transferase [Bacteroidia bacterium]|nr:glycosyl transferase [Bacteroidia bacterium]GHT48098.1 glycosyl transferase [Bacteroidia bacterium]